MKPTLSPSLGPGGAGGGLGAATATGGAAASGTAPTVDESEGGELGVSAGVFGDSAPEATSPDTGTTGA